MGMPNHRTSKILFPIIPWFLPVLIITVWAGVSVGRVLPESILPPPWTVIRTGWALVQSGELTSHLAASTIRVTFGFFLGAITGIFLGLFLGLHRKARRIMKPLVTAFQQVPLFAWMPFFIVLLGIEESSKIVFIAAGCFFPVWVNTYEGVVSLPSAFKEVGRVYQLGTVQSVFKLILPWSMSSLITGLRLSFSLAWMLVVGAELFGSDTGLGALMTWGRQMFQIDVVLVGVLVIGLIGILTNRLLEVMERKLLKWRPVYEN